MQIPERSRIWATSWGGRRQVEGHDAASVGRFRAVYLDAGDFAAQRLHGVGGQLLLVDPDVVHAQAHQVFGGGAHADLFGNRRRAGFELVRNVVEVRAAKVDLADHVAAGKEGRHRLEQLAPCPQRSGAGGPKHLVAGEDVEVGPDLLDVDGMCGTAWAPSISTSAPAAWAISVSCLTGLIVPSMFETWLKATSLGRR